MNGCEQVTKPQRVSQDGAQGSLTPQTASVGSQTRSVQDDKALEFVVSHSCRDAAA
jgi:hypothetical protein